MNSSLKLAEVKKILKAAYTEALKKKKCTKLVNYKDLVNKKKTLQKVPVRTCCATKKDGTACKVKVKTGMKYCGRHA